MQRAELKALTSLRGIAAMAVVLQHFSATAAGLSASWIPSLVPHGYMAVDFFFVLSGFIMAYTYLAGFEESGMQQYRPFLYKRIARIFPLGIAVTLFILCCAAIASNWNRADLFIPLSVLQGDLSLATLVNLAHLQGFLPRFIFNAPSWSVSLELGAYLLFPVLIRLFFGRQLWTAVLATAICVITLVLIESAAAKYLSDRPVLWNIARCLSEFGLGLIAYRAYRGSIFLRRLGDDRWTLAMAALLAVAGLLRLDLLIALSFPPVVLAFALNRGHAGRLLSSRIPYFLGVISFSLYLVHNILRAPLAAALTYLHPDKFSPTDALIFAAAGSLLVLPLAAASHFLVEKPGRGALNGLLLALTRRRMEPIGAD